MNVVTIPKREYKELVDAKLRYEYLRSIFEENIFAPPPVKKIKEVVGAFYATRKYNRKFLESLKKGLKRSSYFE